MVRRGCRSATLVEFTPQFGDCYLKKGTRQVALHLLGRLARVASSVFQRGDVGICGPLPFNFETHRELRGRTGEFPTL